MSETSRMNNETLLNNEFYRGETSRMNDFSIEQGRFNMSETSRMNDNTIRATEANIQQGNRSLDLQEQSMYHGFQQDEISNARADRQEQQNAVNTARNNAYNKMDLGIMPTSSELSAAGISSDEAKSYVDNVKTQNDAAARVAEANAKNATQQSANTETGGSERTISEV